MRLASWLIPILQDRVGTAKGTGQRDMQGSSAHGCQRQDHQVLGHQQVKTYIHWCIELARNSRPHQKGCEWV